MIEPVRRKRIPFRWLRFRLRSLLVLMLLICVYCGWWTARRNWASKQQEAVGKILELRGEVYYDYHRDAEGEWNLRAARPAPGFVSREVGPYHRVLLINLAGEKIRDDDLAPLQAITSAESLMLQHNGIAGHGLKYLRPLRALRHLHLNANDISDVGLAHLAGLKRLEMLDLSNTAISDDGLVHLTHLRNLADLHLDDTHVTASGIQRLQQLLPKCRIHHAEIAAGRSQQ